MSIHPSIICDLVMKLEQTLLSDREIPGAPRPDGDQVSTYDAPHVQTCPALVQATFKRSN